MSSYLIAPGVRFNDCYFSEPVRFAEWTPPPCGGLLAILVRDPDWAPKPFRPLVFGEFGNDALQGFAYARLCAAAMQNLYVAVLPLPFSTAGQRRALRSELAAAYNPIFQARGSASDEELSRRLDEIETRQQEQNAQIIALLQHLTRFLGPQPVGPQRPIGFQPPADPPLTGSGS